MLYISDKQLTREWHIGDPYPVLTGRVITFQADEHELAILLDALRQFSNGELT